MKYFFLALLTGVGERILSYIIKRTESIAANSTGELILWGFKRLFKERKKESTDVEKDIKLGEVGDLDITFSGGKAKLALKAKYTNEGIGLEAESSNSVQMDSSVLVDKLFAAIEKASPPGAVPIEETVKGIIKSAVASL